MVEVETTNTQKALRLIGDARGRDDYEDSGGQSTFIVRRYEEDGKIEQHTHRGFSCSNR